MTASRVWGVICLIGAVAAGWGGYAQPNHASPVAWLLYVVAAILGVAGLTLLIGGTEAAETVGDAVVDVVDGILDSFN